MSRRGPPPSKARLTKSTAANQADSFNSGAGNGIMKSKSSSTRGPDGVVAWKGLRVSN